MKKIAILIVVMSLLGSTAIGSSGNETENSQQKAKSESSATTDKQVNTPVDNSKSKCQKRSSCASKSEKKECTYKAAASKCMSGKNNTYSSEKPI